MTLRSLYLALLLFLVPATVVAQGLPSIASKTQGMEKKDGYFPVYWDADAGKVWLEIPRFDEDFLYVTSMPAGLGSNDVGLDRGRLGGERVVRFERVGPKVLLVAPNLDYRATTDNPLEAKAVRDAFAEGVVWGFTAVAADASTGHVLVDATAFIVRDAQGIVRTLRSRGQGTFRLDEGRSAPHLEMTKAFPDNTEMEARLTFTSDSPGGYVRSVAADPYAVTLRVRHSLVRLPPPGYTPRKLDPRSGYFGMRYVDYATPIGAEKEVRYINRHRLQCAAPPDADGLCTPREPIVYYLDPGTPEPVRSALLDGARWWADAFTAAGFRDAYRVEMLPEGADLMDVRYNVIQWVHRSTRGWSYGSSVSDPRTGEILKGHVSLGSLRVRQDYLIAEGLLAPYADSVASGFSPEADPMLAMALARIRQLSAHEVGHTLGIAHNFAASVNQRASVMDYPAPLAHVAPDGSIDLSAAYDTGIGEWDKVAVRYGYTEVPEGMDEEAALTAILDEALVEGLYYITDSDARPAGAAHPLANLWDNGNDMVTGMNRELAVRASALNRFGLATIREGRPLATMEEVLVPLYLGHRYQVEATVKLVGGVAYSYALRGDANALPQTVHGETQRLALTALLNAVRPEVLRLPTPAHALPPRPPGYGPHRELFDGYTGLTFDPYAPAEVAASMVLSLIVHPERAARLAYQDDFNAGLPGLGEVLVTVSNFVWNEGRVPSDAYDAELSRIVQRVWVDVLLDLAARPKLAPSVRARAVEHLREMHAWLDENPGDRQDHETVAHRHLALDDLDRYLFRDYRPDESAADLTTPPGSPIGSPIGATARQAARQAILDHWHAEHLACSIQ